MSVCMSCNKPRVFSPKGLMSLAAHQMSDEVHGGGGSATTYPAWKNTQSAKDVQ